MMKILSKNSILKLNPGLHKFRKASKILLVEPQKAGSIVIDKNTFSKLRRLHNPIRYEKFIGEYDNSTKFNWDNFLLKCYYAQIISINHSFFRSTTQKSTAQNNLHCFFVIHLTKNCNFKCNYCKNNSPSQNGESIKYELLKLIIGRLATECESKHITLQFHGGEPLLELKKILKIARLSKKLSHQTGKTIKCVFQTNGYLLNKKNIMLLKNNGVEESGISLDGSKEIQDKNRILFNGNGTFNRVWKNYTNCRNSGLNLLIYSTLHNPDDLIPSFEFFHKNKINYIFSHRTTKIGRGRKLFFAHDRNEKFADAYLKLSDWIYNKNCGENKNKIIDHEIKRILDAIAGNKYDMCLRSPCGAGNNMLAFDIDGNIYPCENLIDSNKEFLMGNIKDFDFAKLEENPVYKRLNKRKTEQNVKCGECSWNNICSGGCLADTYYKYGQINKDGEECRLYYKLILNFLWKINTNSDFLSALT